MTESVEKSSQSAAAVPALVMRDPFDVSWRERLAVLGSVGAVLVTAYVLGLIYAHEATVQLTGFVPLSMLAMGKFLPLLGVGPSSHFNPWELGLVIWALDTVTVLVIVYGLEILYSVRRLKRALSAVQTNASLVLTAYPRIRRAAVVGVVCFVLFPLAGTGAMVGSFLGILLGMQRFILIASVSLGGLVGGMVMAFAAVNFGEAMENLRNAQQNPTVRWLIIGTIVAVVVVAFWWLNRLYKRALEAARRELDQAAAAPSDEPTGDP